MPQQAKERIGQRLRLELETVEGLSPEEIDEVIDAFTVLESSSPRTGHIQYRLMHLGPDIEQRSDVANAISRAIHAAGYYLAGEE